MKKAINQASNKATKKQAGPAAGKKTPESKAGPCAPSAKRCCKNCMKGRAVGFNHDVLCREKGIVSEDYVCASHRFFVMDDLKKLEFFRCSECEFFARHPHPTLPNYGVCELFSVRKCDGDMKKACSKFTKRKGITA